MEVLVQLEPLGVVVGQLIVTDGDLVQSRHTGAFAEQEVGAVRVESLSVWVCAQVVCWGSRTQRLSLASLVS